MFKPSPVCKHENDMQDNSLCHSELWCWVLISRMKKQWWNILREEHWQQDTKCCVMTHWCNCWVSHTSQHFVKRPHAVRRGSRWRWLLAGNVNWLTGNLNDSWPAQRDTKRMYFWMGGAFEDLERGEERWRIKSVAEEYAGERGGRLKEVRMRDTGA